MDGIGPRGERAPGPGRARLRRRVSRCLPKAHGQPALKALRYACTSKKLRAPQGGAESATLQGLLVDTPGRKPPSRAKRWPASGRQASACSSVPAGEKGPPEAKVTPPLSKGFQLRSKMRPV